MGTTSGYVCLVIGITSLIASVWRPGSLILAVAALSAAYINLKGEQKQPLDPSTNPSISNPEEPVIQCKKCGTENYTTAKICRGCNKSLKLLD